MQGPTSTTRPRLSNTAARRLFLARHGLCGADGGAGLDGLLALIRQLGFVQIDSINTVERAHHMILAARRRAYRPSQWAILLERRRALFEHWTHDAAAIPTGFFPYWRLRFDRNAARLKERWQRWRGDGFVRSLDDVLADPDSHDALAVLVELPPVKGKAVRINITLDEYLLTEIDRAASRRQMNRSNFLAWAARQAMHQSEDERRALQRAAEDRQGL